MSQENAFEDVCMVRKICKAVITAGQREPVATRNSCDPNCLSYMVLKEGGCPRGGGKWGTLRIPREDWGTLGTIRGITTPLKNPINICSWKLAMPF